MTGALVIAIASSPASGAASAGTESADSRAQDLAVRVSAPDRCWSARKAVTWYRQRNADWLKLRGVHQRLPGRRAPRSCSDARYLAGVAKARSFRARTVTERWIASHVLSDFRVTDGARAWHKAVREAQGPYPGTEAWLLSCSASEGGWGRWVPNSDGAPPGGWMQMYHSTFVRMFSAAKFDLASRGFIVPYSAHSWYSPLGQALASAWGLKNGRRGEWAGSGC